MASMRQLFPFYDPREKTKRNFIKENIRNAKGCNQCLAEKKRQFTTKNDTKIEDSRKPKSVTFKSETKLGVPVIKCNMKIVNRAISSDSNFKNNQCASSNGAPKTNAKAKQPPADKCQTCGQLVIAEKRKTCTGSAEKLDTRSDNNPKDTTVIPNKYYHILSHEREDDSKKTLPNKSMDLSFYKKGKIPRYLQERLAKLMKEEEERKERENLAEKLGLNDPKCPPGHMLMPPEQLKAKLATFSNQYELLIRELNTMPITRDSLRIRNRKTEIDKELKDLDEKISLYRSGKVFIKIPE